jgi:hypothetical protein
MRALLCSFLWGGALVALASTSEAANGRAKDRRPSGYYYNSPTTMSERQLRKQRAYERGEYLRNALSFGSRAWWEQKMREGADER